MDQEIPDYDMDSEDETWLNKQAKKMEVTPLQFENMMDRLEKGSGQVVRMSVQLQGVGKIYCALYLRVAHFSRTPM